MEKIEDSPLLSKINTKLNELADSACEIKISMTAEAEYFEAKDGSRPYVKWLNWQIYDKNEDMLYQSDLFSVHGKLEESALERDLKKFFPNAKSSIDNEIYFED